MEQLKEQFTSLHQACRTIKRPLLVIHPKPDADALGALFSLADYLKSIGIKELQLFSVDKPGKSFDMLYPILRIQHEYDLPTRDALFFIDRGDIYFKLKFDEKIAAAGITPRIINIDHHPHTQLPGALNIIDTTAAATSEIIYRFFEHVKYDFNAQVAQYLLGGIYADTGGFRHNNTTAQSLEIVSRLMRKGASITKVNRTLYANKSLSTLKLWGIALERARINPVTGMVVSFITKEDLDRCDATADDISGISEILNTIADSKFSLVLSQREQNKVKASLRSEEYKGIDVSQIARQFQGGGHKLASGFEIKGSLKKKGDTWIIE